MYSKDKTPRTTTKKLKYKDVIKTIKDFLKKRITYAKKHGIKLSQIIIDPGMGQFISSIPKYSYEIIARLHELKSLKHPILIGASRKSFLGESMKSRIERGSTISAIAYLNGASIIRTHDVKQIKWLKNLN
jgi:dihydropteroate synthase